VRRYAGRVGGGGAVSFRARIERGIATRVLDFRWRKVPLTCAGPFGSSQSRSYGHFGITEVVSAHGRPRKPRHFVTYSNGFTIGQGQGWEVKGRFSAGVNVVRGTLYVSSYVPYPQAPSLTAHCITARKGNPANPEVRWVAWRG